MQYLVGGNIHESMIMIAEQAADPHPLPSAAGISQR
jgi:hypothetical protein